MARHAHRPGQRQAGARDEAVLDQVNALATQLRAVFVAAMGEASFTSARQPWVDMQTRKAYAASTAVGRFRIDDELAPGGTFRLRTWGPPSSGYGASTSEADEVLQVNIATPGAHRWHLHGPARSQSTSPNANIAVALFDGATQRATIASTRQSSDPAEWLALGQEQSLFLPSEGDALTISGKPFSLRNASASTVRLSGAVLLLWR